MNVYILSFATTIAGIKFDDLMYDDVGIGTGCECNVSRGSGLTVLMWACVTETASQRTNHWGSALRHNRHGRDDEGRDVGPAPGANRRFSSGR